RGARPVCCCHDPVVQKQATDCSDAASEVARVSPVPRCPDTGGRPCYSSRSTMLQLHPFRAAVFICALIAIQTPRSSAVDTPKPIEPLPSPAQLAWHEDELTMFTHFGMNTYTGLGTGKGDEDEKLFNPTDLDCKQWVREAKECGFKGIILTAKHH